MQFPSKKEKIRDDKILKNIPIHLETKQSKVIYYQDPEEVQCLLRLKTPRILQKILNKLEKKLQVL